MTATMMIGEMPEELSKLIQDYARPNTSYIRITIDTDICGNYFETAEEKRFYDEKKAEKYWEKLVEDFEDYGYTHINYQKLVYALPKDVYKFNYRNETEKRWCYVPKLEKVVERISCLCCNADCFRSVNDPYADERCCERNGRYYECSRCGIDLCGDCGEWKDFEDGMVCFECIDSDVDI
jgi:hypothetical protein